MYRFVLPPWYEVRDGIDEGNIGRGMVGYREHRVSIVLCLVLDHTIPVIYRIESHLRPTSSQELTKPAEKECGVRPNYSGKFPKRQYLPV